jgi:hypothetical protein
MQVAAGAVTADAACSGPEASFRAPSAGRYSWRWRQPATPLLAAEGCGARNQKAGARPDTDVISMMSAPMSENASAQAVWGRPDVTRHPRNASARYHKKK